MERSSRFASTRRSLKLARYTVVAASAAAFGALALAARAAHTGKSTTSTTAVASPSSSTDDGEVQAQTFDYGSSSVAPSDGGGGVIQSGGS
jgi:hypothetical protein